jgi:hypothetical protein
VSLHELSDSECKQTSQGMTNGISDLYTKLGRNRIRVKKKFERKRNEVLNITYNDWLEPGPV